MSKIDHPNPKLTLANSGLKRTDLNLKQDAKVAAMAQSTPTAAGDGSTMIKGNTGMVVADLLKMASSDVPATADTHRSATSGEDLSMWKMATSDVPWMAKSAKSKGKGD